MIYCITVAFCIVYEIAIEVSKKFKSSTKY